MQEHGNFVPRHKQDFEAAQRAIDAGWPTIQPVAADLLQWCYDSNWPVAKVLGPFLGSLGASILSEVRELLRGDDGCAKYHVIQGVVGAMPVAVLADLEDELRRLAEDPTPDDLREEVPEVAYEELARLPE